VAAPPPSSGKLAGSAISQLSENYELNSIGLFKAELIHRNGPWRNVDAVEYATLGWVDWFNNRRLFELAYHRQRDAQAMVA
jgi:putative transposase